MLYLGVGGLCQAGAYRWVMNRGRQQSKVRSRRQAGIRMSVQWLRDMGQLSYCLGGGQWEYSFCECFEGDVGQRQG
jgi:hypothetical protein